MGLGKGLESKNNHFSHASKIYIFILLKILSRLAFDMN